MVRVFKKTSVCKMAATSASAGVLEVLVSFYRCGMENAFERHRSRTPIGKERRNIRDAKKHLINFLGISQMAISSIRVGYAKDPLQLKVGLKEKCSC